MASVKKGEDLNISKVKKSQNLLQIPIYCNGIFQKYAIMGGGGGNEIANKIYVYDMTNPGDLNTNILRKLVHEESTGKDVANFIDVAHVSNNFAF